MFGWFKKNGNEYDHKDAMLQIELEETPDVSCMLIDNAIVSCTIGLCSDMEYNKDKALAIALDTLRYIKKNGYKP